MLKRLLGLFWFSIVFVIVGLAVMLAAARLLLPGMSAYQAQVEAMASTFVGRRVQIGALDAAWQGLSPVLKLQQVIVHGKEFQGGSLAVQEVHVALDLLKSLGQRQWRTSQLTLIGARIAVATAPADGDGKKRGGNPFGWLLQQESIVLDGVSVDWQDPRWFDDTLQLRDVSLRLFNDGGRHHIALQTRLAQDPDNQLVLMADVTGSGGDPASWRGQMYLNTQALDLTAGSALFRRLGLSVSGRTDLELWAGIDDGRLDWGSGSVVVQEGVLQAGKRAAADFGVERLSSSFRWQAAATGWQVDLRDFAYQREQQPVWPASHLSLVVNREAALRFRGGASLILIEELNRVVPLLPWIDAGELNMLDRLQPAGHLHDVEFDLEFPSASAPTLSARAYFTDLAVAASDGLPGVSGMSGRIEGNLQTGYLYLDSGSSSLHMPQLFSQALELSQLDGTVRWQRYADVFRVESAAIEVASGALAATARLQLDWPYREASPWIDLQVAANSLPLDQVQHYLPDKVMSPRASAWLREALDGGTAHNLRFLLQGRADRIPFDAGQGRLEARFDFEDLLLDYHPQWGQLHDTRGSALFDGRSMRITATGGRIQRSPLRRVVARIEDLARPLLEIDGAVDGTVTGMLNYVAGTPLGKRFGTAINQFDSGGDAQLQLGLRIPLRRGAGKTTVKGRVDLQGNRLTQRQGVLAFSGIRGRLNFTHKGISAKRLDAQLLGSPVVASIYRREAGAGDETVIDMHGRPDLVAAFVKQYPGLSGYINGVADWRALLQIPDLNVDGDPAVKLQLESDLVGVAVDLPEPFYKPASVQRSLLLNWVPDRNSKQAMLVSYGNLVDARILPTADRSSIRKADVRFGSGTAQLPEASEIRIAGQLQELDLDGWLAVSGDLSAPQSGATPAVAMPPVQLHLALMNLTAFGHQVKNLRVDSLSGEPWHFSLKGEGAAGSLRWSPAVDSQAPRLQLALDKLLVKRLDAAARRNAANKLSQPTAWPELDIAIADLNYAGKQLGTIEITGQPGPDGYEFQSLSLKSDAIELDGRGAWSQQGDAQHTRFKGEISGGRLENLSRMFADNSAVQGGALSGRVDFSWLGSPAAFSLAKVEGDLHLKARDGRLVHVDEGAGKLLNLISLNSLQRRLSLDFSDIVKEGFSFDKLEGHFVLAEGDAFTTDFRIAGSSAIINISGRTGLLAKDYDQLVTVIPQVSSSLPIAGAIAGGPAVGAAVFLAEKLVGKEFNRITESQYQVTGSWDKPVYERLAKPR